MSKKARSNIGADCGSGLTRPLVPPCMSPAPSIADQVTSQDVTPRPLCIAYCWVELTGCSCFVVVFQTPSHSDDGRQPALQQSGGQQPQLGRAGRAALEAHEVRLVALLRFWAERDEVRAPYGRVVVVMEDPPPDPRHPPPDMTVVVGITLSRDSIMRQGMSVGLYAESAYTCRGGPPPARPPFPAQHGLLSVHTLG